jgi:hypothetical protein
MSEIPLYHPHPSPLPSEREQLEGVQGLLIVSQGHRVALTGLCVPYSLDSGQHQSSSGVPQDPTVQGYLIHKKHSPPRTLQYHYV